MFEKVSADAFKSAARIKEQIEILEAELQELLRDAGGTSQARPQKTKGSGMSAAGKARIVAAQKARWAKFRRENNLKKPKASGQKGKRTMSASAKAKIAAAARARWAKAKKEGRNSL